MGFFQLVAQLHDLIGELIGQLKLDSIRYSRVNRQKLNDGNDAVMSATNRIPSQPKAKGPTELSLGVPTFNP